MRLKRLSVEPEPQSDAQAGAVSTLGWTPTRPWWTPCVAPQATCPTCWRPIACCMEWTRMSLRMPATRASTSALMQNKASLGLSRCVRGKRGALDKEKKPIETLIDRIEKIEASIRANVKYPFRVIKRQYGYAKVCYPGAHEEHAADQDAVCAIEPVDGAPSIAGGAGISAPEHRQESTSAEQTARKDVKNGAKTPVKTVAVASSEKHPPCNTHLSG